MEGVGVSEGVGGVTVGVKVNVLVGTEVLEGVKDGVTVKVKEGVTDTVHVGVTEGVTEGVKVGVEVKVEVGEGVTVGVLEGVAVMMAGPGVEVGNGSVSVAAAGRVAVRVGVRVPWGANITAIPPRQ